MYCSAGELAAFIVTVWKRLLCEMLSRMNIGNERFAASPRAVPPTSDLCVYASCAARSIRIPSFNVIELYPYNIAS